MTRVIEVEWSPGMVLPVSLAGPGDAATVMVLAHGAGAGPDHPFMVGIRDRCARRGVQVVTFPYPYVAAGRKPPDRLPVLIAAHRAVVDRVNRDSARLVLAGKSMGGRVSSHLAEAGAAGFVFLGYPLVPIGSTEPRDTSHLSALAAPMLFVQGERDRLAPLDLIRGVVAGLPSATLVELPEADHSFRAPKRTGIDDTGMLDRIADVMLGWGPLQAGGAE